MSISLKHFSLLAKRVILAYAVFFLARFLFFIFNLSYFTHYGFAEIIKSFFYGFLFDTSAIAYFNGIFILLHIIPTHFRERRLYQMLLKIIFLFTNGIALLINLIDIGYFPFSGKRTGMEVSGVAGDIPAQTLSYITHYWYLALIWIGIIWLMNIFYPALKTTSKDEKTNQYGLMQFGTEFILMLISASIMFLGARGGWNLKPLNTFDAARFVRTEMIPLTLNTPFQLLLTVQQTGVDEKNYFPAKEVDKIYDPVNSNNLTNDSAGKKNMVLLIVESLGKEYVGYYNKGNGYTPFLDSLMQYSTVYMHAYANGKRSIEGIPSIIASMPSWMDNDYTGSYYQSNILKSAGAYLTELNYDVSFYHGGKNGTMSFDNFVALTGAGKYSGLNEYPNKNDFDGNWGIYDEPYLHYFADELSKKSEPFYSALFTLSSHHPYHVPKQYSGMFKEGSLPIHRTIRYTDHALQLFFDYAKTMPWYKNTVFIITADHSAENEKAYYQTSQGKYEIPFVVFEPQSISKNVLKKETFQHTDILPFILETAGYKDPYFSFSSRGSKTSGTFAVQYFDHIYQMIQWPYVYQFNGDKGIAFYDLTSDSLMNKNLIDEKLILKTQNKMDTLLKSIIQQYNHSLISNSTRVK